jgi:hypothetical protein
MFFKNSSEPNDTMGEVFKGIYIVNFGVNILYVILFKIKANLKKILEFYKSFLKLINPKEYNKIENPRREWFDHRLKVLCENPNSAIAKAYNEHSLELAKTEMEIVTSEPFLENLKKL